MANIKKFLRGNETFNYQNNHPQERPPFQLRIELHRLLTFPLYEPGVAKKELAKNGFFLQENGNIIQCHFCTRTAENYKRFNQNNLRDMISIHANNCPMIDLDQENNNVPFYDTKNYKYEAYRLYTFLDIDWKSPVSPYELARGGYYWTETEDNCRCAFCRLEVRGWEQGDTARGEHERWNPACQFHQGRDWGNVRIGDEITELNAVTADGTVEPNIATLNNPFATYRKYKLLEQNIKYMNIEAKNKSVEDLGITFITAAKYPDYIQLSKRSDSYKLWPVSLPQTPKALSEAGFFYTGVGDRVICYQCGGGLKDWSQNDDPWVEHAKWFSTCSYLAIKKGKLFVDQSINGNFFTKLRTMGSQINTTAHSKHAFVKRSCRIFYGDEVGTSMFNTTDPGPYRELTCKLCKAAEINIVNLQCGHMEYCTNCSSTKPKFCGVCNKEIFCFLKDVRTC